MYTSNVEDFSLSFHLKKSVDVSVKTISLLYLMIWLISEFVSNDKQLKATYNSCISVLIEKRISVAVN